MKLAFINIKKLDSGKVADSSGGGVKTITCKDRVRMYRNRIANDKLKKRCKTN